VVENLTGPSCWPGASPWLAEGGEARRSLALAIWPPGKRPGAVQHLWCPERAVVLPVQAVSKLPGSIVCFLFPPPCFFFGFFSLRVLSSLWPPALREHTPLQYLRSGLCPWRDLELQVAPGRADPAQGNRAAVDLALELMAQQAPDSPSPTSCAGPDLGTGFRCFWPLALARR